jgi:opacity protein-like surface antigen
MKTTIYTLAIAALLPISAYAGGLSDPIVTPPIASSVPPQTSWTGPYVGIFGGQRTIDTTSEISRQTVTPTYEEIPIYDQCKDDGGHSGGDKCSGDRDNIDLTFGPDLPFHNGWKNTGLYGNDQDRAFLLNEAVTIVDGEGNVISQGVTDGTNPSGTLYRLDTGETETVRGPDLIETFVETVNGEETDTTFGGFVGYRYDAGSYVVGAEAGSDGTLHTLEAHVGLPVENVLPYAFAGYATDGDQSGASYGAGIDVALTGGLFAGVGYRQTEFSEDAFARVGWAF